MRPKLFKEVGYDGGIFIVRVQDIPGKRKDVVQGAGALHNVAIWIVDVLGAEVLVTNEPA